MYASVEDYLKTIRERTRKIVEEIEGEVAEVVRVVPRHVLDGFFIESSVKVEEAVVICDDNKYAKEDVVQAFSSGLHVMSLPLQVKERVMLPSTRNEKITGQEKLAVDVALLLPHVCETDKVCVVGSYSENRGGGSYKLFAGRVSEVHLYDPLETEMSYVYGGTGTKTKFFHHARAVGKDEKIICDVFLNDAYELQGSGKFESVNIDFEARVYSLKRFEQDGFFKQGSFKYIQIKRTKHGEWREVSHERTVQLYKYGTGSCCLCREISYFYQGNVEELMVDWPMYHGIGRECTKATSPRLLDSRFCCQEIGSMTFSPVYKKLPDGFYADESWKLVKASGRRMNLDRAVTSTSNGNAHYLYSRFKQFEIFDSRSAVVYTTQPNGPELTLEVPIHLRLSPSFLFQDNLVIGTRVYKIQFFEKKTRVMLKRKEKKESTQFIEKRIKESEPDVKIMSVKMVVFDEPRNYKFKSAVLSYMGKFVLKVFSWKEIQQYVAREMNNSFKYFDDAVTSQIEIQDRVHD